MEFLESLWSAPPDQSRCCRCQKVIKPQDTLARTYTFRRHNDHSDEAYDPSGIVVPGLSGQIRIRNRHLNCLLEATRYVVISHVWHPGVAELQWKRAKATANVEDVARAVREVPARIAVGLQQEFPEDVEIWHDYISVPQWATGKKDIIREIPRIFCHAESTIAYLSDISSNVVETMRQDPRRDDRVRAISTLCNAKWFSRVWTAMEFVESKKLRAMFQDFTLMRELKPGHDFFAEMTGAWYTELAKSGDAFELENITNPNLVPWKLGHLDLIRILRRNSLPTTFAIAFELLEKRRVTVRRDFFYAFLGAISPDVPLHMPQISSDSNEEFHEGLLQIARRCIEDNDYTPLFITPRSAEIQGNVPTDPKMIGYKSLHSFSMGHFKKAAPRSNIRIKGRCPVLKVENVGSTKAVKAWEWGFTPMSLFSEIVEFVFGVTGSNTEAFVNTLAVRLYSLERDKVMEHLSYSTRMIDLKEKLAALHHEKEPPARQRIIDWIAENLCLSNTDSFNPMSEVVSPIDFLMTHGGSVHYGNPPILVTVECSRCHELFILRVGLFRLPSDVVGSVAYRVPGLQYRFTHEGGAGWLIKNGIRIGRFVWGIPTCECPKLEEVEIKIGDLPLPKPNEYKYEFN
ncbi:hypothetical protein F4821DRAFT_20712 [Hypoxylon rubiginosum]|uniref:Uncharacterized protein n=1 Tax=Hypoxylon rubiginosum TaxID=110542 RepID=A0ACC0DDD6_9PEZI|nr:hypothetical protein F4821DRAFT_20712 [Hypoxylon rubiginosum]